MDRQRTHFRILLLSTAVVGIGFLLRGIWCTPQAEFAAATPHTISHSDHPFDADWPDVYLILQKKCVGCHRPGNEDCFDFTSHKALLAAGTQAASGTNEEEDAEPVIVPGKPNDSLLWTAVAWNVTAEEDSDLDDEPTMPEEKHEWLTKGQLETVYRWIQNGAFQYRLPQTCNLRPLLEIDFPSAKECKACHPKQYAEWSRSMHHYAQHSPLFEAFNLALLERTGGTLGTFCSRCHTPLGTALGENGLRRNVHRSQLSMEGVTCVVCHRRTQPMHKTNARDYIQPGKLLDTCLYGPFDDGMTPNGSHASAKNPFIKTSAFCGSCHDVNSPNGVRLEEAFSEWQNSPAAKDGITCQHCHMGPVQGQPCPDSLRPLGRAAVVPGVDEERIPLRPLADHTFAGPDYSVLPDTEFPHKLDWMYETDYRQSECLTPYQQKTLAELRIRNRKHLRIAREKRFELLHRAAELCVTAPKCAAPGERVAIHVDVTNHVAGHSFPTGFTAERQLWVEIRVFGPHGDLLFCSGDTDKNGDLRDSHSHGVEAGEIGYDRHLLNFQNKFVALTQQGTERSVVLSVNRHLLPLSFVRPASGSSLSFGRPPTFRIAKGSLPPLGTLGQTYPVQLPPRAGECVVDISLNFRHLPPALLDAISASHLKHLLEIVPIDRHRTVIRVGM